MDATLRVKGLTYGVAPFCLVCVPRTDRYIASACADSRCAESPAEPPPEHVHDMEHMDMPMDDGAKGVDADAGRERVVAVQQAGEVRAAGTN